MEHSKPIREVTFVEDSGGPLSDLYTGKTIAGMTEPIAIPRVGDFIFIHMSESPGYHWEVTRVFWHMQDLDGHNIENCSYTIVYIGLKLAP